MGKIMELNMRAKFDTSRLLLRNTTLMATGLAFILLAGVVQASGDVANTTEPSQLELTEDIAKPKIDEKRASEIALKKVPGKVTGVAIEKKFGKNVYAVEIMSRQGKETDVFVDMNNGKVLGTD